MDARRAASDPNQNGRGRRRQSPARIQGLVSAPMLPHIPQSADFIRAAPVKTLQCAPGDARSPEKPNERRPRRRHLLDIGGAAAFFPAAAPLLRIPQSIDFIRAAPVKTLQCAPGDARSPEKPNDSPTPPPPRAWQRGSRLSSKSLNLPPFLPRVSRIRSAASIARPVHARRGSERRHRAHARDVYAPGVVLVPLALAAGGGD